MSTMGVGTNILGYSNKEVDQAAKELSKMEIYPHLTLLKK